MRVSRLVRKVCAAALLLALPSASLAQSSPLPEVAPIPNAVQATAEGLMSRGLQDQLAYRLTEAMTTEIGPRLAGSEAEERARQWSMRELRRLGFSNVRVEPFPIDFWSRVVERATVVGPAAQPLVISALGSSPPTPEGGVRGQVVRFDSLEALRAVPAGSLTGKIVFIDEPTFSTQDGSGYGLGVAKRSQCSPVSAEKGAVACLIRSVGTQLRRFPHTGQQARTGPSGLVPAAALSPPDADQLGRLLQRGPVNVELEIRTETRADAPSGNVIAELRGRERPEEIVLVSCHLDSWDMGTGALDDAVGCGIVTAAVKLIAELPRRPRRTIQIVYFGSEEVGLLGARAYAAADPARLERIVMASQSDFGFGRVWAADSGVNPAALPYARAIQQVLRGLDIVPDTSNRASGGPDVSVLKAQGVPVFGLEQDGRDYFDFHHTPDDTFDKIELAPVQQNVAAWAAFTYLAAELDWNWRTGPAPVAAAGTP
jgi:hypothetical protein